MWRSTNPRFDQSVAAAEPIRTFGERPAGQCASIVLVISKRHGERLRLYLRQKQMSQFSAV